MVPPGRILPRVLAEVIRKAPLSAEKVEFAWRTAVGPVVARQGAVRLDEAGTLRVTATDPHWALEIQQSARLILPRVAGLLGDGVVRALHVEAAAPPASFSTRSRHA